VTERAVRSPHSPTLGRRELIAGLVTAVGDQACARCPEVTITAPTPGSADACEGAATLSILTWNVWMMPPWTLTSPRNGPRAAAIAAALLERDFDIICLQKVFDGGARAVLEGALAERYPYRYGPANDWISLELNSGVWVLSRHCLSDCREIEFGECDDVECYSRKGALLLSGCRGGRQFRLIATHLQGEEGPAFTPLHQCLRDEQAIEIRRRLLEPYLEPGVPFFICGDFGTPRFTDDGRFETPSYRRLLTNLGAQNGSEARITYDDVPRDDDLAEEKTGRKNELDYIFLRSNGCDVTVERRVHHFTHAGWDSGCPPRHDLSYRFALGADITFGSGPLGPFVPLAPLERDPSHPTGACRNKYRRGGP
jgi:endonuclease/exonuclease/phosphatase family metal-dependent hydrolase